MRAASRKQSSLPEGPEYILVFAKRKGMEQALPTGRHRKKSPGRLVTWANGRGLL